MPEHDRIAFAIGAHPDDIEFMMAGTLLLLGKAGYELHYLNIANGSGGTATHSKEEIVSIRTAEAQSAARLLGARFHPPLVDDLDIMYEQDLLAKVAAVVREVQPEVLLVPSLQDYMEDHVNASRLAVTAAFSREIRTFPTDPPVAPVDKEVTIYHALPYGLRDGMRRLVVPEYYVDISEVLAAKREALAQHASQKEWLDESQGVNAYLETMEQMSAEVGRMSGRWEYAEGWRRHSHLGFCEEDADPLAEALDEQVLVNEDYRRGLAGPFA